MVGNKGGTHCVRKLKPENVLKGNSRSTKMVKNPCFMDRSSEPDATKPMP
jgi:hypothetical protein